MADEEINQLKAGHLPAGIVLHGKKLVAICNINEKEVTSVKAGGMQIVQHKTPNTERPAKDLEDCTGLTTPPNITITVSGVTVKAIPDYLTEAVQTAHAPKVPQNIPQKHAGHFIHQPKKQ